MLHRMTPEQWNEVIYVNLASIFNMSRQVIEDMRERGFGRIINISSINGQKGQVGQSNYAAAKAGMIGFTKSLAQENAKKGVTVNCVAARLYRHRDGAGGAAEGDGRHRRRHLRWAGWAQPRRSPSCVAFLARDDASFITGATLTVNGGQYIAG